MIEPNNKTKELKFYSKKSIGIATFIGGPMAAGYLIRENFLALNQTDKGKKTFLIGIISTFILFGGIFLIPENIIEKIPNQIIPLIYTGVVYLIVEKILGEVLNTHEENKNEFFSSWKAAGIGFISLLIIVIIGIGCVFLGPESEDINMYDTNIATFSNNENESLVFYDNLNTRTNAQLIEELDKLAIPKWKENIIILERSRQIKNLSPELLQQNELLLEYSKLRLQAFEQFRKSILEDSVLFSIKLQELHNKIDDQLSKLNE